MPRQQPQGYGHGISRVNNFEHGVMLGRVLELSEHTAALAEHTSSKVDVIESRQVMLIQRIDKLEAVPPLIPQTPVAKIALAIVAAGAGVLANLKAESVGEMIGALLKASH